MERGKLIKVSLFLLLLVLVLISLRGIIFESGFVFSGDTVFPFDGGQVRESFFNRFSLWYGKIGDYSPTLPSGIPFWSIYNLLSLFLGLDVLTKLAFAAPLIIACFSMYFFSKRYVSIPASILASFLYVFNPWVFDRLVSGHIYLLLSYALMPAPLMFIFKLREGENPFFFSVKEIILSGLVLGLILTLTMHIFALFCLIVALYAIFIALTQRKKYRLSVFIRWIGAIAAAFAIALLLNSYWLIPTSASLSSVKSTIDSDVSISTLNALNRFTTLPNILRLTGYWLPYFRDSVGNLGALSGVWFVASFAIPIFAFALLLLKRSKVAVFFSVTAIVSLVPPVIASANPNIYSMLIQSIPLFALFRDSDKFLAIVALAFSVLIAGLLQQLLLRYQNQKFTLPCNASGLILNSSKKYLKKLITGFLVVVILFSAIVYASPNLVTGNLGGKLAATSLPTYWYDVKSYLDNETDASWRVLWTPIFPEVRYDWTDLSGIDPSDEYFTSLYSVSSKSSNPAMSKYVQFLKDSLYANNSYFQLGKAVAPLSVKYVVLRLDARPLYADAQYYSATKLQHVLDNQQDMTKVFQSGKWVIYENRDLQPFIGTSSSNLLLVLGNLSEIETLGNIFREDLPPLAFIDPNTPSSPNNEKIVYSSNVMANSNKLILTIPFSQTSAIYRLAKQINGNISFLYYGGRGDMSFETSNLVLNPSFEEGFCYWDFGDPLFSSEITSSNARQGQKGLEVTTCSSLRTWSWITSGNITVDPETIYKISMNIKLVNAMQSHVKVLAFNESENCWETASYVSTGIDGTLNWNEWESLWDSGNYTKIRIVLNAGWVKDPSMGNATTLFDDVSVTPLMIGNSVSEATVYPLERKAKLDLNILSSSDYKIGLKFLNLSSPSSLKFTSSNSQQCVEISMQPDSQGFSYSSPVHLDANNYTLEMTFDKPALFDTLIIFSVEKKNETISSLLQNVAPAEVVTFERVNPTSYTAEVNATGPFLLSFAEPYDPSWAAFVSGQRIESMPLYSSINGYWINATGLLHITFEYEPQKLFYYGSVLSIVTCILCFAVIAYDVKRKRSLCVT